MKTLYVECNMGAAGDMLAAALLELHPNPADFVARMNGLGLPGVTVAAAPAEKCGLRGTHLQVTVHGQEEHSHDCAPGEMHPGHAHAHAHAHAHTEKPEHAHLHFDDHAHSHGHEETAHHHATLSTVRHLVQGLAVPQAVQETVMRVYESIAHAEGKAHGMPAEQVHFHEVGALDAVADITAVCWLLHELAPQQIVASPVHVGSGQVRCAHGILPVPAPATAELLRGVPIYGGAVQGELCTPTGAALLRCFAASFGPMPLMTVEKIGCGMGSKDFAQANCVRAFWGETPTQGDTVAELACNLDDMTPEDIGFAQEILFEAGALEVYTTSVQMKKNRPGLVLTCMCRQEDAPRMAGLLLRHTTTLGVRETTSRRYTLTRTVQTVKTPFGPVRRKVAFDTTTHKEKWEYDDLARVAREQGLALAQVRTQLDEALRNGRNEKE